MDEPGKKMAESELAYVRRNWDAMPEHVRESLLESDRLRELQQHAVYHRFAMLLISTYRHTEKEGVPEVPGDPQAAT
jgi:hypothetical protein